MTKDKLTKAKKYDIIKNDFMKEVIQMIERTESLIRAENEIKQANLHVKILAQYNPSDNQVESYIYAFQNVMKRYDNLQRLMETVEDDYDDTEEMDEVVYEAANNVVCGVKAFYNDIKNYQEYERQVSDREESR